MVMQKKSFYTQYACYASYTPPLFRLLVLFLLPVGLPIVSIGLTVLSGAVLAVPMLCVYLGIDLLVDHFVFGASLTRGAGGMELVRSSDRGMDYYRNVIAFDTARRALVPLFTAFFFRILLAALPYGVHASSEDTGWLSIEGYLFCVMVLFAVESLSLLLVRHATLLWLNILIIYAAVIVMLLLYFIVLDFPPIATHPPASLVIGLFLALFSGRLLFRQSIKKREESYYDDKKHS